MPLRQVQAMNKSRVVPEGTTKRYREGNFHTSYTTLNELGRGRFAVVRKCKHKDTNRHFAAKFVRKRKMGRDCREDILKEIRILEDAYVNQRLIGLHEVYETSTEVILVLEYALGGELHQYCVVDKEDAFSERDVVRLLRQILEGVHYLHKQNIAHLDLKPQNILLTSKEPGQGDIKLIDFGIARYLHHGEEIRDIQGTPDYVAPEILNYEPITLATDMWSIGVLTYVMLTGVSPFAGDTKQETFLNISQVNLDFAEEDFSCHSPEAQDFIRNLCIKESEKRLTAEECLKHPWILKFTNIEVELDANDNVTQQEKCNIGCEVSSITVDFVICKCDRKSHPLNQTSCGKKNCLDNRIPSCESGVGEEKKDNEQVGGSSAHEIASVNGEASVDDTMSDVDVHMECESKDEHTDLTSEEGLRSRQKSEGAETVDIGAQRRGSTTPLSSGKVGGGNENAGDVSTKSPHLPPETERHAETKCLTCNRLHPEGPGGLSDRTPSPSSSPMGTRRAFCPTKENSPSEIHEPKRFCLQVPAQQPGQVVC